MHWYGRLPVAENVIGALVPPGAIPPVSKPLPVAVWVIESALRQTTLCPTLTVAELGENDCEPAMPRIVIVTSITGVGVGAGVGVGLGVGVGAGVGVGVGAGAGPGVPIGGGAGVGNGLGAGGSTGVGVGEGSGVGVGVEEAVGGVLATGEDELPPHPETGRVDPASTTRATEPPSDRRAPRGQGEGRARGRVAIVSSPSPGRPTPG